MKFYRFQAINKLTLQNLRNQMNWVSDPFLFNDPFEFSIVDKFYRKANGVPQMRTASEQKKLEEINLEIEKYGVVCYSSDYNINLLWSHYADNHRGMCLVFDVTDDRLSGMTKVNYQEDFPNIDLNDDSGNWKQITKVVSTKSIDWEYEQEYREVFIMKNMLNEYPGKLVEVIFGCRTPFDDMTLVRDIVVPKNPNMSISKMQIVRNRYELSKDTAKSNDGIPHLWKLNFKK